MVIVFSGIVKKSAEQAQGLEIGADGYITRPISNRELIARVEAMLRIKIAEENRPAMLLNWSAAIRN